MAKQTQIIEGFIDSDHDNIIISKTAGNGDYSELNIDYIDKDRHPDSKRKIKVTIELEDL